MNWTQEINKWIKSTQAYLLLKEWILTFSEKRSLLSSKKIERFVFVFSGVVLTWFFVIYNREKLTAIDFTVVVTPLFVYAGYNMSKTEKSKKPGDENEHANTANNSASGVNKP